MSIKQTISSTERQNVHPLESNDPVAFRYIETVALSWLEQNAGAPLPRHQDLPFEAFEKATGRSVLVALSHGWYYQTHPDPEGNKLELIQKEFAPKLRERYPNTHIVVFFDFLATPQWPRTKEEDKIFRIAMKHMNSIYVYCDVALFLEARLPQVDLSELMSRICLNRYEFGVFRASIQVKHIKQIEEKKSDDYEYPQVNDIILAVDKKNVKSLEDLKAIMDNKVREVSFLRRPYGIPNTIPNGDRGWLLLERVTIAIKAAAARKEDFDEIVLSDSPSVRKEIYVMCDRLREAAKKSKNRHSKHILKEELAHFENLLERKKFSFASDKAVVKALMDKLITRFSENWESESKKQRSMSKRVHEILLRWGAFSPKYIHECGFLSQKTRSDDLAETWRYLVFVIIVCPALVAPLFAFDVSDEPSILSSNSWKVALWVGSLQHIEAIALNCAMSLSLADISPDLENLLISCGVAIPLHVIFIIILYYMFGTLPPYTTLIDAVFYLTVFDRLFSLKMIPVKDEYTGHVKRWNLGTWMNLPSSTRFDPKTRYQYRRTILTTMILWSLFTSYPILSAVFNEQSVVVQAIMVPIFFGLRAMYEYVVVLTTGRTFGSDSLTCTTYAGVISHEVCLAIIISSMKSPVVFASLILCDVFENGYCLWSLARTSKKSRVKVAPIEQKMNSTEPSMRMRATSIFQAVKNVDEVHNDGTALFISATLLQRELIETTMPIQAGIILSILYISGAKGNAAVSGWTDDTTQSP